MTRDPCDVCGSTKSTYVGGPAHCAFCGRTLCDAHWSEPCPGPVTDTWTKYFQGCHDTADTLSMIAAGR